MTLLGSPKRRAFVAGALTLGAAVQSLACSAAEAKPDVAHAAQRTADKEIVRKSFEAWAARKGGPFDLLEDDASWTIVGNSAASKTYPTKEDFMRDVIRPFNARLKEPLTPVIRGLYADGNTVIVFFDAAGVARDGEPYRNTYTWYLEMSAGRVTKVTAFYDAIAFNDLWTRVAPAP